MGVVRRSFDVQVTFCPLTSFGIAADRYPRPNSSEFTPPNLLNSNNLEVTIALARTVPVFGVCLSSFLHYYSQILESILKRERASSLSATAVRLPVPSILVTNDLSPIFTSIRSSEFRLWLPCKLIGLRVLFPKPFYSRDRFEVVRGSDCCPLENKHEVDLAQLLVHDDAALNKFKTDHGIPKDIQIECPRTNEDANLVEGNKDCIPGNHYLHLRNPHQPQTRLITNNPDKELFLNEFVWVSDFNDLFKHCSEKCKKAIQVVNNRLASRKLTNLLAYEPIYRHVILHKADKLSRIRFPALCIEGRAPQCGDFDSEGAKLSLSEVPLLDKCKGKQLARGPSKKAKKKKKETSSALLPFATKDHDNNLALAQAVSLPKDVANLAEEGSEDIRDLLVMASKELLLFQSEAGPRCCCPRTRCQLCCRHVSSGRGGCYPREPRQGPGGAGEGRLRLGLRVGVQPRD
ncbi:hypothetical protein Acr_00g0069670 [Actinidia rufa]|uniref:Uncharacterized protein n=1 Tax=Actinidia rufa TaxID=165716 RepID=A0A7J0DRA8_9ERIC|nr:hypothetical protein Acr_00g0069670 [Actinidia rufa]